MSSTTPATEKLARPIAGLASEDQLNFSILDARLKDGGANALANFENLVDLARDVVAAVPKASIAEPILQNSIKLLTVYYGIRSSDNNHARTPSEARELFSALQQLVRIDKLGVDAKVAVIEYREMMAYKNLRKDIEEINLNGFLEAVFDYVEAYQVSQKIESLQREIENRYNLENPKLSKIIRLSAELSDWISCAPEESKKPPCVPHSMLQHQRTTVGINHASKVRLMRLGSEPVCVLEKDALFN